MNGLAIIVKSSKDAIEAVKSLREMEYERIDVHSPYPLEELDDLLPTRPSRVSRVVFLVASAGAIGAYLLQYITAVYVYPFDIAGTPHNSWPAFLPVTFEGTVLIGSLTAFFSVFFFCKLPRYHHPVFDIPGFERTTRDRFAVVVTADDSRFDAERTHSDLDSLEKGDVHVF